MSWKRSGGKPSDKPSARRDSNIKQDPAKAEQAGNIPENLKAKAASGELALYYLDECSFPPTLPIGSS